MRLLWKLSVMAASLVLGGSCLAEPITYTETLLASGTIDGASYTNKLLTLTAVGDTSQIVHSNSDFYTVPVSMTFALQGEPSGTFFGPSFVFENLYFPLISFEDQVYSFDGQVPSSSVEAGVFDDFDDGLPNYDLATSVMASGGGGYNNGNVFATTVGGLSVFPAAGSNDAVTFSAVLAPAVTPEPASWLLLGSGLLGMAAPVLRRRLASDRAQTIR